jgi:hypothetical protein
MSILYHTGNNQLFILVFNVFISQSEYQSSGLHLLSINILAVLQFLSNISINQFQSLSTPSLHMFSFQASQTNKLK